MSADPDRPSACPSANEKPLTQPQTGQNSDSFKDETSDRKRKKSRSVTFPEVNRLVTQYFEPANPWQDVPSTSRSQLAAEYLELCRRHNTAPIDVVLQQIRELPDSCMGGQSRAPRLTLSECNLSGTAPSDALEALFRRVQFRRLEIDHVSLDDDGAEAIFDMIEYYESANVVSISGPRQFGIRGWQAASRLIKKSAELLELEISESPLEGSHVPVFSRALRPVACTIRALCLQRSALCGDPLLCLVIALKSNTSIRELRLADNRLSVSDGAQLAALLRYNTRIQLLDLSNNMIQDAGVGHIAEALVDQAARTPPSAPETPTSPHSCPLVGHEFRGLAFLVLWNNQLTRNCAIHLSKALRVSRSLCVLNIGRNALGCETVRALQGVSLVSLGLQAARLTADAAKPLADLLKASHTLQRLDLRDNRLGSAGLKTILKAIKDNRTLTQIDLDDPVDPPNTTTSEDLELAKIASFTREIRSHCRRNEPASASPERRVHRKISLTCNTACLVRSGLNPEEERRVSRLRSPAPSPAPSPAGSPVPAPHAASRFMVTRVTPDRESSSESGSPSTPTRPTYCTTPSRFRVVQVAEPPQIQVHPATQPRRPTSRFSVTRNYDSVYNTTPVTGRVDKPPSIADVKITQSTPELRSRTDVDARQEISNLGTSERVLANTDAKGVIKVSKSAPEIRTDVPKVNEIGESTENSDCILTDKNKDIQNAKTVKPLESSFNPVKVSRFITRKVEEPVDSRLDKKIEEPIVSNFITKIVDDSLELLVSSDNKQMDVEKSPSPIVSKDNASNISVPRSNEELRPMDTVLKSIYEKKNIDAKHSIASQTKIAFTAPVLRLDEAKIECSNELIHETVDVTDSKLTDAIKATNSNVPETNTTIACPKMAEKSRSADLLRSDLPVLDKKPDLSKETEIFFASNTKDKNTKNNMESIKSDIPQSGLIHSDFNTYKDKSEHITHSEEHCGDVVKTETKLVQNNVTVSDCEQLDVQVEVTVKKSAPTKVCVNKDVDFVNIDEMKQDNNTMKQIEMITHDLGNLIKDMKDYSNSSKNVKDVPANVRDNVVLKKNKSESSLDSPDFEVSRLMNKKHVGSPFCDSSSSLEISGSSMESLNVEVSKPIIVHETDVELDRRKDVIFSTESSVESTSDATPVNNNFLNTSVSSNESVSPIFCKGKKIHGSLSSLEASVSSLDSGRHEKVMVSSEEKVMVTSADSGIEYSLQHPTENKDYNSSNEGTLTNSSSLKETVKKPDGLVNETLTSSPKRASSLLDVPALKSKGLDRMKKMSWVVPSSSFHIPRPDPEKDAKPSHLDKLLSLFHPSSLFSRSSQSDDEKKSSSNTPPRKDSSITGSFWSWGSTVQDKDDRDDNSSSEATDSTLSERVQISYVDESFSRKLDSKTPSTDTDNTLSEFQSFPTHVSETIDAETFRVTNITTDDNLVQKCLGLSLKSTENVSSVDNRASDNIDLIEPNDLNRNFDSTNEEKPAEDIKNDEGKEPARPRSFAAVLKSSGSENSLDKQMSPENGQPVDKLPSKVIRGIKENISPENTLTSSMTNTKALASELSERQVKNQTVVSMIWEVTPHMDRVDLKSDENKVHSDLAPIATIEETCDESADNTIQLDYIDDEKPDQNVYKDDVIIEKDLKVDKSTLLQNVDLGKDALSYLAFENEAFASKNKAQSTLAEELKEAEIKEMLDLSPELVIDEAIEVPEVFTAKEVKGLKSSPVIPERAKLKKSNSLENLSKLVEDTQKSSPKTKTIAFKVPESTPRDIPERRTKLRTRSGSSPKSLPESLNKPCPLSKMDTILSKKKKKPSSLGKMARDSLLALNMSDEEIAEFRRSYKLTSVESLKSLESVSEDANSQSGNSVDSRCRACLRTSQESLMSLDSITEDCRCGDDCEKPRSAR